MLRDLDVDGTLGLQSAPPTLLDAAWQRTHGNPRALEALWAILASDPDASPTALLDAIASPAAEKVAEIWAGEVYRRIDAAAQRVMQGLAIYGRPMTPTAVAYLWQLSPSELRSAPISKRLVTLRLVRKEGTRYYLHAADRQAALAQVALTQPLYQRAADYFRQARKPREEWKMLDDLAPQLAEFELRCAAEEFDAAAEVITSIDLDYLMLWGHYRLVAECHDRLRGRLSDRGLQAASLTTLGNAYIDMGAARNAVIAYEQALSIDRTEGDRLGEASDLGNLGVAYRRLGDLRQAIDYYEQALAMTRAAGDRRGEANFLGNLGITYAAMGETRRAIGYYEQALAIARATGDRREETRRLGNLGLAHADLGETAQAIAWHEQALAITRATGDRWGEAVHLGNLAEEMVDAGRYAEAASLALESVRIGEEIGTPGSYSHGQLALAYLHTGDLPAARAAAEVACRYQEPRHNHNVLALLGVIARRQGDDATARAAFGTAVAHAEAMLAYDPRNYDALDAKGLALSGLASLATGEQRQVNTSAAAAAYRAARAFNQDPGIVGRVLRLLDALALADRDSPAFLIPIRAAAGA
jgi:tetratricopeptide (TPR) repeat protein